MDKYVQIWMKKGLSGLGKKHSFAEKRGSVFILICL